jgi:glutathione S-transferase
LAKAQKIPILYSFRRCPYAIRTRMALFYCGVRVELREVVLKSKPESMLLYSPKGTVPILVLEDGRVIDESVDIVNWALSVYDPMQLKSGFSIADLNELKFLQETNDFVFKPHLDRYKYADRYPEGSALEYRKNCQVFIESLESRLERTCFLMGEYKTVADILLLPFVRQFAHVDKKWFDTTEYFHVRRWLSDEIESSAFIKVIKKHPPWNPEQQPIVFP